MWNFKCEKQLFTHTQSILIHWHGFTTGLILKVRVFIDRKLPPNSEKLGWPQYK